MVISRIGTSGSPAAHSAVVLCSWTLPSHFLKFSAGLESISTKNEEPFSDFHEKNMSRLDYSWFRRYEDLGLRNFSVRFCGPTQLFLVANDLFPTFSDSFERFFEKNEERFTVFSRKNTKMQRIRSSKRLKCEIFENVEHLGAPPTRISDLCYMCDWSHIWFSQNWSALWKLECTLECTFGLGAHITENTSPELTSEMIWTFWWYVWISGVNSRTIFDSQV